MSSQEPQSSFGVLFPAFSCLPMKAERSRNKERLEASLAGLCELELLKQRQELRVLGALCLGDPPDAPTVGEAQNSSLHCTPWGFKASLEQQVAELKVKSEVKASDSPTAVEKSQSPGENHVPQQSRSTESDPCSPSAPKGRAEMGETGEMCQSDSMRKTVVIETFGEMRAFDSQEGYQQAQKLETYIVGIIQRKALPTRPSKPRTSLAHETRAAGTVRQSSLCCKEEQHSHRQVPAQEIATLFQRSEETPPQPCHNLGQEHNLGTGSSEGAPTEYHQLLQQSIQHQPWLSHRPRQAPIVNASRLTMSDYPTVKLLQAQPDSSNSESDSPKNFHNYPSYPVSKPHQPLLPDEQLVNAEYIPAQPYQAPIRSYTYHHSNTHKGSGGPKPNRSTYSPERAHHHHHRHHHHQEQQPTASQSQPLKSRGGHKKCRANEERSGVSRKPGKKACRSQSENSLQRESKYNTVERDGTGSGSGGGRGSRGSQSKTKKQQQQGGGSYRRWQSSLDLSQDEADQPSVQAAIQGMSASNQRDHCSKRTRKSRPMHTLYAYSHHQHHHHHHQQMEYQLEQGQVAMCLQPSENYHHTGQGESESSTSEADSPDSSSLSSDSDESGGLVWPQQLPPQLSVPPTPAPPGVSLQPKAFVKIKASHALKKKILRFRTGSLKVMTTV